MKRAYLFSTLVLLTSCFSTNTENIVEELISTDSANTTIKTKNVQFVFSGITEEYATRATVASTGCTDIYIFEGTTLLAHKISTDEDFATPTLTLNYGSHDITFIASLSEDQSFDTKWNCTKVKDTFAKTMNITVSSSSSSSRQVALTRRNSKVQFTCNDKIPTDVKKVHLKVASHRALDNNLMGNESFNYDATVDIASKIGTTGYTNFTNIISESLDEEACHVTIEFLSSSNEILYKYENDVNVKPNRCTHLKGNFFAGDASLDISVTTTWDTTYEVAI